MITGNFTSKRKLFDSAILKQAIENIGIPVQVQWNSAKPPTSIFGKPKNLTPKDFSNANQVSVFYKNVEVISAYALKAGIGKILIRDKMLSEEQVKQVRSAFENAGIKLEVPSIIPVALTSGLHFAILAVIMLIGFVIGDLLFILIGGLGILTIILAFVLMTAGFEVVGLIFLVIGIILTAPSCLLQFLMLRYLSAINEEKNPRKLYDNSL